MLACAPGYVEPYTPWCSEVLPPPELATRINDAKPKVIVSASCGIEVSRVIPYKPLLDGAIDMATSSPNASSSSSGRRAEARDDPGPGIRVG